MLVNSTFDTFPIDFAGPLPETGTKCTYILLSVEHLFGSVWVSRRVDAKLTVWQTVDVQISICQEETIEQFECLSVVLINQTPVFMSTSWKNALETEKANDRMAATYSFQYIGRIERIKEKIKSALTPIVMDRETERNKLFPTIVIAIFENRGDEAYSLYDMILAYFPKCLLFSNVKKIGVFFSDLERSTSIFRL